MIYLKIAKYLILKEQCSLSYFLHYKCIASNLIASSFVNFSLPSLHLANNFG